MIKLLCVEDSKEVQLIIKRTFLSTAQVLTATTLLEAYKELKQNIIDFIILDLSLPDGDGFEFLTRLNENEHFAKIPVIILTSKTQIQNKVLAFHMGAEDYIPKPFDPVELKIRVEARLKRHQQVKEGETLTQAGNLTINHLEQKVFTFFDNQTEIIELTSMEFKILSFLAKYKDQVMSREQIINAAWKQNFSISDRTIDSHISRIRKKISRSDHTIIAIHNAGYKFSLQTMNSVKIA